jgi:hypothetical protein
VEKFFISTYYLLTGCMSRYWNGLYAKRGIPWFYWSDPGMAKPGGKTYSNWGYDSTINQTEPVNLPYTATYICGAGMLNESTASGAWGWSNRNCSEKNVFICRISRGWLGWACSGVGGSALAAEDGLRAWC